MVKKFLDDRGIHYELKTVRDSPAAAAEFLELGGRLPPLTIINGVRIEGYRPTALQQALDEAEGTTLPDLPMG
jgi:hypothetical protein